MTYTYDIDGYIVRFTEWVSDDWGDMVAVSIRKDGIELYHAGHTKAEPSEQSAKDHVELLKAFERGEQ